MAAEERDEWSGEGTAGEAGSRDGGDEAAPAEPAGVRSRWARGEGAERVVSVARALELLEQAARVLGSETVPLAEAAGRVLARPFFSPAHLPPFARSAMDGYAVRAADVAGASSTRPRALRLQGRVLAGSVATRPLEPGGAFRIATGAQLPPGADAVVRQEVTAVDPASGQVLVFRGVEPGRDVVQPGTEARAGQGLLPAGWVLGANDLGLLAALGQTEVEVVRRPRVVYVETGSELVSPGEPLPAGHIYGSNSLVLSVRAREHGAEVAGCRRVGDDPGELAACCEEAAGAADLVVSTGGVSVGPKDLVPEALLALGWRPLFHGLRMTPGRPMMVAERDGKLWIALSGNPAAALVTHELFVRPVLWRMGGLRFAQGFNPSVRARLRGPIPEPRGRPRFYLGRLDFTGREPQVVVDGEHSPTGLAAPFPFNAVVEIPPRGSLAGRREPAERVTAYWTESRGGAGPLIPFPWEVGGILLAGGGGNNPGAPSPFRPSDVSPSISLPPRPSDDPASIHLPVRRSDVPPLVAAYRALRAVCARVLVVGASPEQAAQLAAWEGPEGRAACYEVSHEASLRALLAGLQQTPQSVALCVGAGAPEVDGAALRAFLEAVRARWMPRAEEIPAGGEGSGAAPPLPCFTWGEEPRAALLPVALARREGEKLLSGALGGALNPLGELARRLKGQAIPLPPGMEAEPVSAGGVLAGAGGRGAAELGASPVVLAFCGHSGSGKTTLISRLIRCLRERGWRVGVIKHGHRFDLDRPGKDSWRFREAGAERVVLASDHHVAFMADVSQPPSLEELLVWAGGRGPDAVDVILAEGFKAVPWPKVLMLRDDEAYRDHPLAGDPHLQGVYGGRSSEGAGVPAFPRTAGDDDPAILWLLDWIAARRPAAR